jgi:hypothetical protein
VEAISFIAEILEAQRDKRMSASWQIYDKPGVSCGKQLLRYFDASTTFET